MASCERANISHIRDAPPLLPLARAFTSTQYHIAPTPPISRQAQPRALGSTGPPALHESTIHIDAIPRPYRQAVKASLIREPSTDRLSRILFPRVADIQDARISRNRQDDQDQANVDQRYFQEGEKQGSTPWALFSFA